MSRRSSPVLWGPSDRNAVFAKRMAVLFAIASDPAVTVDEIARQVASTDRHVRRLLRELESAGYVSTTGPQNKNHYALRRDAPVLEGRPRPTLGDLLDLLTAPAQD